LEQGISADLTSHTSPEQNLDPSYVLVVRNLNVVLDGVTIIDDLDISVERGEIFGIAGSSGAGKSVLMQAILGLVHRGAGQVYINGREVSQKDVQTTQKYTEPDWGVMFQQGALFSSLTALDNVKVPMRAHLDISESLMDELAYFKLDLVGLSESVADKYPAELSGGMVKRVALARALALDPAIVFLDEPTSGLDPVGAQNFDELIVRLRNALRLTVCMVTHDPASLQTVCDRVAIIEDKRILIQGNIKTVLTCDTPLIRRYFHRGMVQNS